MSVTARGGTLEIYINVSDIWQPGELHMLYYILLLGQVHKLKKPSTGDLGANNDRTQSRPRQTRMETEHRYKYKKKPPILAMSGMITTP
jgi:hypothetical protein